MAADLSYATAQGQRPSLPVRMLALAVFLLFACQSYLVQTHVHKVPLRDHASYTAPHHSRTPGDDNPATCPLCQAGVTSGTFMVPVLPAYLPALVHVARAQVHAVRAFATAAFSHDWFSRGPPR